MVILGLDVSTKTGYAVLSDGALIDFGTYLEAKSVQIPEKYATITDLAFVFVARHVATFALRLVVKYNPDLIIIEQTNKGRNRTTQKMLEFIHYAILSCLVQDDYQNRIRYVDTSQWRSFLQVRLSKDQRKHNKAVKEKRVRGKITAKHLAVKYVNDKFQLNLKLKDNDAADAICLCMYGANNAPPLNPIIDLDKALS